MNLKVGINSPQIKEFGGEIDACKVNIIELALDKVNFLDGETEKELLLKASKLTSAFGSEFTIHAPHSDSNIERIRVDFSTNDKRNIAVMEMVFRIAAKIGTRYIVVHPGNLNESRKCLNLNVLNLVHLSSLAEEYGVILLLENLFDRERRNKIGVLPGEILYIIEAVNSDNLKINLDIGHAFIVSNTYGLSLDDYFELGEYINQLHLHDNFGILEPEEARFGDRHLPLGLGKINFSEVFKNIPKTNARNLILELKDSVKEDTLKSLSQLREFTKELQCLMPVIAYSPEQAIAYAHQRQKTDFLCSCHFY